MSRSPREKKSASLIALWNFWMSSLVCFVACGMGVVEGVKVSPLLRRNSWAVVSVKVFDKLIMDLLVFGCIQFMKF